MSSNSTAYEGLWTEYVVRVALSSLTVSSV